MKFVIQRVKNVNSLNQLWYIVKTSNGFEFISASNEKVLSTVRLGFSKSSRLFLSNTQNGTHSLFELYCRCGFTFMKFPC